MGGNQRIIDMAFAVLSARCVEDAERAFAALAREDLRAANGLGVVLCLAAPSSAPLWAAILERAKEQPGDAIARATDEAERPKPKPKAFRWTANDATDTAAKLAARMGWQDMERQGA
jgi:hypothetical protein